MIKKRFISMLALLMTAVTGAWAQEVTLLTTIESKDYKSFTSGSKTFDNIATVTFSNLVNNDGDNWGWYSSGERTLTVTAAEGYTITRVKFYNASGSAFDEEAPFEAFLGYDNGANYAKVNGTSIGTWGVTKIEVYGYAGTPEPATSTYTVTLKEGTEDATSWTIAPDEATTTGVAAGTEVKATYGGVKKVKSVKAVKKAAPAAKAAAEATAEDKGKLIGTDGKIYADVAAATAAGTTAVAKIIYLGTTGHATYTHGLALALTDEGQMAWEAAKTACNTTKNTSTPVTGATWLLASKDQWDYMLGTNGAGSYTALRDGFSDITGASNLQSGDYWSSTEDEDESYLAWLFKFGYGSWDTDMKFEEEYWVRACLAF